jgi:hypothetical protein
MPHSPFMYPSSFCLYSFPGSFFILHAPGIRFLLFQKKVHKIPSPLLGSTTHQSSINNPQSPIPSSPAPIRFLFDTRIETCTRKVYPQGIRNFFLPSLAQQFVPEGDPEGANGALPFGPVPDRAEEPGVGLHRNICSSFVSQKQIPLLFFFLLPFFILPSLPLKTYPDQLTPLSSLTGLDSHDINSEIKTEFLQHSYPERRRDRPFEASAT